MRETETRPSGHAPKSGQIPQGRMRFAKPLTTPALVGWTALSVILPGAAHLRAGHRRTGYILLGIFGALLLTALIVGLVLGTDIAGFAAQDGALLGGAVLATSARSPGSCWCSRPTSPCGPTG